MEKYVEIRINKPLYGTMAYIRDTYINRAKKLNIPLRIVLPEGTAEYSAKEWLKGAKRMEKVFLIPDKPMVLFGKIVEIGHKAEITLKGKAKKIAEAFEKYNKMSDEEKFLKFIN